MAAQEKLKYINMAAQENSTNLTTALQDQTLAHETNPFQVVNNSCP